MTALEKIKEVFKTEIAFLFFRKVKPDLKNLGGYYIAFILFTSWLAGIGRYWDHPRPEIWQSLGLVSVVYIFVLAFILWIIILPLFPANWSYKSVLVFVGMTSPLGILYAIPVEKFFKLGTAQTINVWFLAIVATWRVILLFLFMKRSAKLGGFTVVVASLLPLALIITILTVLNMETVVFELMAGITSEPTGNDQAYMVLFFLTIISTMLSPALILVYFALIYFRRKKLNKEIEMDNK